MYLCAQETAIAYVIDSKQKAHFGLKSSKVNVTSPKCDI